MSISQSALATEAPTLARTGVLNGGGGRGARICSVEGVATYYSNGRTVAIRI